MKTDINKSSLKSSHVLFFSSGIFQKAFKSTIVITKLAGRTKKAIVNENVEN